MERAQWRNDVRAADGFAGSLIERGGSRAGPQPGRFRHPDPHPGESPRPSSAPARDGRPAPRQHPSPGLGGSLDRRAPVLPDRGSGLGPRFRAWRAQRDIKAVIPAQRGCLNPQSHDPERYKARNAVERGIGGLKPWRRVATRYDKHAQRCLDFLYLASAWIWLKS